MAKTLKQLREGARYRYDDGDAGDVVSDVEANDYVNEANTELHDILIFADSEQQLVAHATNLPRVSPDSSSFKLPQNFYRMTSVHVRRGEHWIAATSGDPGMYPELAARRHDHHRPEYYWRRDRTTGEKFLWVFPTPDEGDIGVLYWPMAKELAEDTDQIEASQHEYEFIMTSAAIRMLNKVERDSTALLKARMDLTKRIRKAMQASDTSGPDMIRKVAHRYTQGWPRW